MIIVCELPAMKRQERDNCRSKYLRLQIFAGFMLNKYETVT